MKTLKWKLTVSILLLVASLTVIFICTTLPKADIEKNDLTYTSRLLRKSFTEDEFRLFTSLIHAETKDSSYETKLAFANIILNRLCNNKYPNTISDIIYDEDAFISVKDGALNKHLWEYDCGNFKSKKHKETLKAAHDAINGLNNIGIRMNYNQYWPKKDYSSYGNSKIVDNYIFW